MFYGAKTTNKQEVNVNTSFLVSFSDTAMLSVGAWNRNLSIQLKPCTGVNADGVKQYADDRSQYITTSITPDNAIALAEGFEKEILPCMRGEKESGAVSIVMGDADKRKVLTIYYEDGESYLGIATELDSVGKSQKELRHKFNKRSYLVDYNPMEGNAVEKFVDSDLISFMNKVREVEWLSPVIPHAIRYNDANILGYKSAKGGSGGDMSMMPKPDEYSAPTSSVSSMDEFLPFA